MQENTDQKNSEYEHFSRGDSICAQARFQKRNWLLIMRTLNALLIVNLDQFADLIQKIKYSR